MVNARPTMALHQVGAAEPVSACELEFTGGTTMQPDHEYNPSDVQVISFVGTESPFNNIRSLIEYLRHAMYLIGVISVGNLDSFLHGFAYAKANGGEPGDLEYLNRFNLWVRDRYKTTSDQGWGKIIAFFSM